MDIDHRRTALAPVLRDLDATAIGLLVVEERGDEIWLRQPDGSGVGLPSIWEDSPDDVPRLVIEAVQDAAIEALRHRTGTASWPDCPDHPRTHPLDPRGEPPTDWTCPATGRVIAAIGELKQAR